MNITDRLLKLDPTLKRYNEGKWGKDALIEPGFTSFNDAGIECETGEFLYSMVRLLKPAFVLETGTHWGVGASYMGLALKDNGDGGVLDTYEFIPEIYERACTRFKKLDLYGKTVYPYLTDAMTAVINHKYKLMLFDTEPATRFAEVLRFYPYLEEGGFLFIHDLHQHMSQEPNEEHGFGWPFGPLPSELADLVKSDKLRPFHFRTPRGLTGFYKVQEGDYKWT